MKGSDPNIASVLANRSYIIDMIDDHPEIGPALRQISVHLREKAKNLATKPIELTTTN